MLAFLPNTISTHLSQMEIIQDMEAGSHSSGWHSWWDFCQLLGLLLAHRHGLAFKTQGLCFCRDLTRAWRWPRVHVQVFSRALVSCGLTGWQSATPQRERVFLVRPGGVTVFIFSAWAVPLGTWVPSFLWRWSHYMVFIIQVGICMLFYICKLYKGVNFDCLCCPLSFSH